MIIFYRLFFVVYWSFLTFLALIPISESKQIFPYIDKVIHFLSFVILLFLFDKSFEKPISFFVVATFFCYGILVEFAQSFTETRSAEISDLLANASGLLVYYFFAPKLK